MISINRNIVECKVMYPHFISHLSVVLIETLWNVKIYRIAYKRGKIYVLIETLWNVKNRISGEGKEMSGVLIETLWNVKDR